MRKYFAILGLLALLIPLVLGVIPHTPDAQAQEPEASPKISSLLAVQVEAKARAVKTGRMLAAPDERRVDLLETTEIKPEALDKQGIFIHLAQELNPSQIAELEAMGITLYLDSWTPPVGDHPTGFILADMPIDKLEELAAKDYVVRLDTAEQVVEWHNDLATQKINADDVWALGYDGTGIKIAVIDSGLDVAHPDIPTPIASWDYAQNDSTIANTHTGHGTHVTGCALGRGTQSGGVYKGSAPGADLIFLKVGSDITGGPVYAAEVNAMGAAVDVYNADVITMSIGGWDAYHDGTSQIAQKVDYAVSQGAVVFISAGNDADADQHYSGTVAGNSWSEWIEINISTSGYRLYYNMVWYDGTSRNDLELHYYNSSKSELSPVTSIGQTESSRGTESEYSYYGSGGDITSTVAGTYYLRVYNDSSAGQFFHIYNMRSGVTFDSPDPNYTLTTPADANGAIAVGAYTTRKFWWDYQNNQQPPTSAQTVDQICTLSNRGPRVDTGAPLKPNIVAPGSAIISCRDNDIYPWPNPAYDWRIIDNEGPNANDPTKNDGSGPADYYVMQGTSMASPHAAGVAALILDKNPGWTPAQVKDALESTATDKGDTGWDTIYGYGLIDALAALGDTTPPSDPTDVTSPSHTPSVWSTDNTVDVNWTDATDDASGLDGYSILWDTTSNTIPDQTKDIEEGVETTTSPALADGNSHYFHIRSVDNAGNWQSTVHLGPFFIDATPPTMEAIVEAEGQYYNTAPSFSNFGFDDNVALDDGWYQMDSYAGTWTALFTDAPGTSWDNDDWTIPGFGALAEGSHTIYFKASDDAGSVEGEAGEWSWQFFKDTTAPTDPTDVTSTSHTPSVWSTDNAVDITWTDATDATSDLDGYSILWDTTSNTIPDQTKDIEEGVEATTSPALADGDSHYFHIRSVDNAGNWQSTVHLGPFFIDTTPPTDPTDVTSTSHTPSVWSTDNTVDVTWTDATDATSDLDGYSILWDTTSNTIPDQTKDIEEGVEATTSPALADGDSHYFHIRSVDNAGNWQSTVHIGPFYIDTTPPTDPADVTSTSHTPSVWSTDNTVDVTWTDATDTTSDLDGYSILWDTTSNTIPDQTKDIEEGVETTTSPALADGDSHYFHIRSVDNAGNWQSTVHLGPFFIDTATLPTMEPIAEAEGQYYNTAPSFSNFGFDDNVALDDGWYQMDSFAGTWTALFSDASGTSWDDDGWTIPGFGALAEGTHSIYFKASDDAGNVEGESGEWSWQFFKDTTPPSDPTDVTSTSHTPSVWSTDNTVDVTWTDATDATSGLDGYSILWDTSLTTIPDQTKDIEEGVQAATSPALADGNSHYFHIRSVDNAGNWQSTVHLGPFFIDTTSPTDPTGVGSTSHTPSVWSSDNTIDITWTDATDVTSGLDGYSILWDTSPTTIPDQTKDIEEGVEAATSPALADGDSHYFHIRSVDNASNWQSTVHLGPFFIDTTPPTAVTDLAISNPTRTSMNLTWTAPGDDANTGTASTYDIRYSTSPITAVNWASATQCTGEPAPSAAGSTETFTVTALVDNTTYYFALKTADKVPNWSTLSNVATGTTQNSPPVLSGGAVSPTSGYTSTTFTYSVTYTDADNDPPMSITITIDGGTPQNMSVKAGEDGDYTNGEIYEYTATGADLGLGSHTFQFAANDGIDNATGDTGSHSGPTVSSPPAGGGGPGGRDIKPPRLSDISTCGIAETSADLCWKTQELSDSQVEYRASPSMLSELDEAMVINHHTRLIGLTPGTTYYYKTMSRDKAGNLAVSVEYTFTTLGTPPAAQVSELKITPGEVDIGEDVTISVLVLNIGHATRTYDVSLKMDNVTVATEEVTVAGDASESVTFTVSRDVAATYAVSVDGLSGSFVVRAVPLKAVPLKPAAFSISNLTISPAEVITGESVTISVMVVNTGELEGSHTVTLKINGVAEETKEVTLAAGASKTVSFVVSKDTPGSYEAEIDVQTGEFTLLPPPIAISWPLIGGIVAAAAVIGLAIVLLVRRRRAIAS